MNYTVTPENIEQTYAEMEPLYREHYAEMAARLTALGMDVPPYNPRLDEYFKAARAGYLLHYVLRSDGKPCGYGNCYITNDMHNHEKIATEDTVFVTMVHRNGIGRKFVKLILEDLRKRGVKKLIVCARTDLRVANLWRRMGFKETAVQMEYSF